MTAQEQQQAERRKVARGIFIEDQIIEHPVWDADALGDDSWHSAVGLKRLENKFTKFEKDKDKERQPFFASIRKIARAGRCPVRMVRRGLPKLRRVALVKGSPEKIGLATTWRLAPLTVEALDKALAKWNGLAPEERERLKGTPDETQGVPMTKRKGSTPAETQGVPPTDRKGTHDETQRYSEVISRREDPEVNSLPERESNLSLSVGETAEACRAVKGWPWDTKTRRAQEDIVSQLIEAGHSADDIVACVTANAGEIQASLRYLIPLLPRWKASRDLPPGTAPCWKCGFLVVMQRGDQLAGVQVGERWQHKNCPSKIRACFACARPVDPVTPESRSEEFEATTSIAGFEVKFADGRKVVTHNGSCETKTWETADTIFAEIEAKKAGSP